MTARRRWLGLTAAVAGLGWLGRRLGRVEVVGDSMRPSLQPGDRLVLWRARRARRGDVVAVTDPRRADRTVVKRVAASTARGLTLLGDNPDASTDSRVFGSVGRDAVKGRLLYRYHPVGRRGWLSRRVPGGRYAPG